MASTERSEPDAGARPLTFADLDRFDLTTIAALKAKPKKVDGLAELDIRSVLDLLTDYPRRYLDRTRQAAIRDLVPGDEAMVIARVVRDVDPPDAGPTVTSADHRRRQRRRRPPPHHVLQPAVAGAAAAAGHRGGVLRQGRHLSGSPPALEPRRRPDRRQDRAHRPALRAEREAPHHHLGDRRLGRRRARRSAHAAGSPSRSPTTVLRSVRLRRPGHGAARHPPARGDGRRGAGPHAGWCSTSCSASSSRSCCASGPWSGSPPASVTTRAASSCGGSRTRLPYDAHRRAGADDRRDRRGTSADRTRCTGSCRATSAPARRWSPSAPSSPRSRAATRAR